MTIAISKFVGWLDVFMMKDSADEIIRMVYPEIKSGTKWSALKIVQYSLRIKDIIGVTQTNRAGLSSTSKKVFSKVDAKGKRDILSEEIRMFEEEQIKVSAITQAKQCAWTKWNDIEPIKLSWKSLFAMEPLAISFLLCSTNGLLPNVTNLKLWGYTDSELCFRVKVIAVLCATYYLHVHNRFRCTHGDITRY